MAVEQLSRMLQDKSYFVGIAAGTISVAIPEWVLDSGEWTINHNILVGILLAVLILDQLVGRRLAKESPILNKSSSVMIDSVYRDISMLILVGISYGIDYLIGTGSVVFVFITASLIYHNFYSFLANAVVLGWGKNFPLWLFKWLDNEIKVKTKKYFPESEIENELEEKLKEDSSH